MIYILDPSFRDIRGHYQTYDFAVARGASELGIKTVVFGHAEVNELADNDLRVVATFSNDIWATQSDRDFHDPESLRFMNNCFASEAQNRLYRYRLSPGDVMFAPNVNKGQLLGCAQLAEIFCPQGVRFRILLRYQKAFYEGKVAEEAFRCIEKLVAKYDVSLITDSYRLADDLRSLTSCPIKIVPIPHPAANVSASDAALRHDCGKESVKSPESRALHFVSLGNARGEKGFSEIVEAIDILSKKHDTRNFYFTLQCNDPSSDVAAAVKRLKENCPENVRLIDKPLNTKEYEELLESADFVLLPYHKSVYSARTSGPFLEAVTAGKPVIITADTWMSDVLSLSLGGIVIHDLSAENLVKGILEALKRCEELSRRAEQGARRLLKAHNPQNLVLHLMNDATRTPVPKPKRALIVFPWDDAAEVKSGAAVRLYLQCRFLETRFDQICIVHRGQDDFEFSERTHGRAYPFRRQLPVMLEAILTWGLQALGASNEIVFHILYHLGSYRNSEMKTLLQEYMKPVDAVFLEYSYFAPIVCELGRELGIPVVLNQHDLLSNKIISRFFPYHFLRWLEFRALKQADFVTLPTLDEAETARQNGIKAYLVPHPVDPSAQEIISIEDAKKLLKEYEGIDVNRRICIFVGSNYGPNIEAANALKNIARDIREDMLIVVAGGVMSRLREPNFLALGKVPPKSLAALYKVADVVVLPLKSGTGLSVKTLEAFAASKVVISTSIGVRGIPAENGIHCIIEDDLARFPALLEEILDTPNKFSPMASAARQLSEGYDYRKVFATFDHILDLDAESQRVGSR